MNESALVDRVIQALWPTPKSPTVWAILDCARDPQIYPALLASRLEHLCLYAGQLPAELRVAAPYLVELAAGYRFTRPLLEQGWGHSWGVFLRIGDARNLRHHLRGFLRVQDESGRPLVFRYYDPRVLRAYLPTCEPTELATVFGPIASFVVEADRGSALLEFSFERRKLATRRTALASAPEAA